MDLGHLERFFSELDRNIIGVDDTSDQDFSFNATQILVQNTYELPLPIMLPGSTIDYEFSSEGGDLEFGVLFMKPQDTDSNHNDDIAGKDGDRGDDHDDNDDKPKTSTLESEPEAVLIKAIEKVKSEETWVSGSFQAPRSYGTLYFVWDNSFSWIKSKLLSYNIRMFQPTFSLIDEERTRKAYQLLKKARDKSIRIRRRLERANRTIDNIKESLGGLEEKRVTLQSRLKRHEDRCDLATHMVEQITGEYTRVHQLSMGLLIRALDDALLTRVLSFIFPPGLSIKDLWLKRKHLTAALLVNRKWNFLCKFSRQILDGKDVLSLYEDQVMNNNNNNDNNNTSSITTDNNINTDNSTYNEGVDGRNSNDNKKKTGSIKSIKHGAMAALPSSTSSSSMDEIDMDTLHGDAQDGVLFVPFPVQPWQQMQALFDNRSPTGIVGGVVGGVGSEYLEEEKGNHHDNHRSNNKGKSSSDRDGSERYRDRDRGSASPSTTTSQISSTIFNDSNAHAGAYNTSSKQNADKDSSSPLDLHMSRSEVSSGVSVSGNTISRENSRDRYRDMHGSVPYGSHITNNSTPSRDERRHKNHHNHHSDRNNSDRNNSDRERRTGGQGSGTNVDSNSDIQFSQSRSHSRYHRTKEESGLGSSASGIDRMGSGTGTESVWETISDTYGSGRSVASNIDNFSATGDIYFSNSQMQSQLQSGWHTQSPQAYHHRQSPPNSPLPSPFPGLIMGQNVNTVQVQVPNQVQGLPIGQYPFANQPSHSYSNSNNRKKHSHSSSRSNRDSSRQTVQSKNGKPPTDPQYFSSASQSQQSTLRDQSMIQSQSSSSSSHQGLFFHGQSQATYGQGQSQMHVQGSSESYIPAMIDYNQHNNMNTIGAGSVSSQQMMQGNAYSSHTSNNRHKQHNNNHQHQNNLNSSRRDRSNSHTPSST